MFLPRNKYKFHHYSFKILPRFWLVKTARIIHHNQLVLTKNFVILNRWRQKCSPPQIIEPLTEKTSKRGYVFLTKSEMAANRFTSLKIFWMNNKAIIEFGFRRIWRILQISEGFIHLGLQPRWIKPSSTWKILHILFSLICQCMIDTSSDLLRSSSTNFGKC